MRSEIETYELIEKYLRGKLSKPEQIAFEAKVVDDNNLKQQLESQRAIFELLEDSNTIDIKKQVHAIHVRAKFIKSVLIAITITTSIALMLFVFNLNRNINPIKETPTAHTDSADIQPNKLLRNPVPVGNTVRDTSAPTKTIVVQTREKAVAQQKKALTQTDSIIIASQIKNHKSTEQEKLKLKDSLPAKIKSAITDKPILPKNVSKLSYENVPIKTAPKKYDCSKTHFYAELNAKESCNNKATGSIIINQASIEGGTSPYKFALNDTSEFKFGHAIRNLPPKYYDVYIQDSNNCMGYLGGAYVESIDCEYNYVIAPSKGEKWRVPNENIACKLTIYNTSGLVIYEEEHPYNSELYWHGYAQNNSELPMGVYMFNLVLQDGSSKQGNITIVR